MRRRIAAQGREPMPRGRFFLIAALGAALLGLALARGVGPTLDPLIETAQLLERVLRPGSALSSACEPDPALAAEPPKPGIAAFIEVEGSLFRILVGHDRAGETWSAAVRGEE
jgi:hypothetical protein